MLNWTKVNDQHTHTTNSGARLTVSPTRTVADLNTLVWRADAVCTERSQRGWPVPVVHRIGIYPTAEAAMEAAERIAAYLQPAA